MKKLLVILYSTLYLSIGNAVPINIILPSAPGGVAQKLGMLFSEYLNDNGVENIITYHPGANGDIGLNEVIRLKDNVIFSTSWAFVALNPVVSEKTSTYNETLEFVAAPLVSATMGFLSNNKSFKTLNELISYAKTTPLPCGIIAAHGFLELKDLNTRHGTQFEPVYYKGNSVLRADLVEGSLKCAYDSVGSHIPLHEVKKLNILALSKPIRDLDVPLISTTIKETVKSSNWFGYSIPKNSNLLKDEKLIIIIKAFAKSKKLEQFVGTPGFAIETIDPNIGKVMEKQTEYYRRIYTQVK